MRYPGGKNGDGTWQRIICQIPPHRVYCEPFLGSGAVMRRKRPANLSIGIDLDPGALAEFRECARVDLPGILVVTSDAESVVWRRDGRRSPAIYLPRADALEWLVELGPWGADDVIYCDPPYLPETRTKKRIYEYEMTYAQHVQLLDVVVELPCRVLLSGYASPLYAERLADWRCIEYDAMTRGGVTRREGLWCNFPEPTELHDYRWIGRDSEERPAWRDRERILRRQVNWRRQLLAMPPLERNAMLEILNADPHAESGERGS